MRYEDFEIEVRSIGKNRYEARVMKSPRGGRIGEKFIPPFSAGQLPSVLSAMQLRVRTSSLANREMVWEDEEGEPMPSIEVEELGRKLFQSLFPEKVEARFRESLAIVRERGGDRKDWGLRLRVTFDQKEDFALLATLPWELMHEPEGFINRCRITPVVRSLNVREPAVPAVVDAPLRVLLIPSNPRDLDRLGTERELKLVEKALAQNPEIETVTKRRLGLSELRRTLLDGGIHIVHFMGHGGLPENGRDEFLLYFEDEDGFSLPVKSMQLAEYLQEIPGLRLVVLNSCWSGAFPRRHGQDPFKSVAAALISRGTVPAVVAMQFPISDKAAIAFSSAFYSRLASGDPVSAAATEGRLAIPELGQGCPEWVTPVVYLAGKDDGFEIRSSSVPVAPRPTRNTSPLRLAVVSFHDAYMADAEPPDDVLDLTTFFEGPRGRYIQKASLWRDEVYPRLHEFLRRHARERRPLILDFSAHATLAFAAGYCLEAKSGLDVTMLQRRLDGVYAWKAEAGPARPGILWQEEPEVVLDPEKDAVALAVSATHPVLTDVEIYLRKSRKAGRIIPMTLHPKPSATGVEDGLHALQLAQDLSLRIKARTPEQRRKPLHLFASAPNALLFFLGQLGRGFGEIQLYEHDFDARGKPGAYMPSLRLPVRSVD